jgi:hypothetical protein
MAAKPPKALTPRAAQRVKDLATLPLPSTAAHFRNVGSPSVSESLGAEIRARRNVKRSERVSFYDWSMEVPEPKTGRLDFDRFPFQVELYREGGSDRELVISKSTQVGVSAWLLRWTMYWADMRGLTALYVFPKLKQMYDFSDARIRAAILKSSYLQSRIPSSSVQNKGLKAVGGGFVYFRGSESEDDLDSVDADVLSLDEYNRLTPENIPVAERRISGSRLGLVRRVGVPTIPGFGISRLFDQSDQRRWYVKCRCGVEQALSWTANVDEERALRVCRRCRQELRPDEIARGRWVAEAESDVRGYSIPKLIVPEVDMAALLGRFQRRLPEERMAFWNRDMAEPYAPAEGRLSVEAIQAAQSSGLSAGVKALVVASDKCRGIGVPGYVGENVVTMGVDVAARRDLNVRISELWPGGRKACLFVGVVSDFNEVAKLMDRYSVRMCCVDHLPEGRLARALAESFSGRVYLVRYATTAMHKVLAIDEANRTVSVKRTEAIDACFELIRAQRNLLPPELPEDYTRQMQAPVRVAERDDQGRRKVYYASPEADDYAHAEVYDLVAGMMWGYRQTVDRDSEEYYSKLEDHLDFKRTALHSDDDAVYVPGLEADYRGGLDDDLRYVSGFGE